MTVEDVLPDHMLELLQDTEFNCLTVVRKHLVISRWKLAPLSCCPAVAQQCGTKKPAVMSYAKPYVYH